MSESKEVEQLKRNVAWTQVEHSCHSSLPERQDGMAQREKGPTKMRPMEPMSAPDQDRLAEINAEWTESHVGAAWQLMQQYVADLTAEREALAQEVVLLRDAVALTDRDAGLTEAADVIEKLQQENARLKAEREAVRAKLATVFVESEWKLMLRWRDAFLGESDHETVGTLCAPDNQLICYAIVDAMTLRAVDEIMNPPDQAHEVA